MDFSDIKELIAIIDSSKLRSFELSNNGTFVKMSKNSFEPTQASTVASTVEQIHLPVEKQHAENAVRVGEEMPNEEKEKEISLGNAVKAPIVGTFYASPAPDKPSFVSIGSKVKKGDVLCIIEAMKVMNEIVSEFDGEVVEICAKDGELVEYGMQLFTIA
ncbi:MAG: acetyl-CoA carboxylase biotin carboxyl carrier protein [Firmicutes bacterium]|nr:acetyl-CoA carboxylase biotin carboxyl carrier protein [Bacillota bacterium]